MTSQSETPNPVTSDVSASGLSSGAGGSVDHVDSLVYSAATMGSATIGGIPPFSPFPPTATGDGSWTPGYDPSGLATAMFGFSGPTAAAAAPSMLSSQPMQNQFFFPSQDMVWSQDPLMMNSSWLISPVAMEQPTPLGSAGSGLPIDGSAAVDPMAGIGQSFSGLALNNSLLVQPADPMMATIPVQNQPLSVDPSNLSTVTTGMDSAAPPMVHSDKPKSWAAIASQPAKPKPPPPKPAPEVQENIGRRFQRTNPSSTNPSTGQGRSQQSGQPSAASVVMSGGTGVGGRSMRRGPSKPTGSTGSSGGKSGMPDVVNRLIAENKYNPSDMALTLTNARFFVIKSYAEDDIHRSIKYSVWCSTEHGNRRLDSAFRDQKAKGGNIYLFYSVNGSGHFCGVAQMVSEVNFSQDTGIWTQDKWKGRFGVKWIYVKDVPNNQLRHIRLENNENKPVTNSRDTQEVPPDKGKMVLKIIHQYQHATSIFDDFEHYEKRQEEDNPPPKKVCNVFGRMHMGMKLVMKKFRWHKYGVCLVVMICIHVLHLAHCVHVHSVPECYFSETLVSLGCQLLAIGGSWLC